MIITASKSGDTKQIHYSFESAVDYILKHNGEEHYIIKALGVHNGCEEDVYEAVKSRIFGEEQIWY